MRDWRSISVLIAGCGSIGRRHGRVLAGMGLTDLRGCDPNPTQRTVFQGEVPSGKLHDSFASGLADQPEAVFICTPTWMHLPMAEQALRAGCHVLIEKPLAPTPEGVASLLRLTAEQRAKVMVALCFRYHEGLLRARAALRAGRIGRLVGIRAMVGEHLPEMRPDYRQLFSSRYAGALDLIHEVDLACWFADAPVRRVAGLSGTFSDIGIAAPDLAELIVEFDAPFQGSARRCLASVHLDFFQRPRRRQIELMGSEGTIIVEFASWDRCTLSVYEAAKGAWEQLELATQRDDMFRAEDRDFLQAIAGDSPVSCSIGEGLRSVDVVSQVYTFPEPPGGAQ